MVDTIQVTVPHDGLSKLVVHGYTGDTSFVLSLEAAQCIADALQKHKEAEWAAAAKAERERNEAALASLQSVVTIAGVQWRVQTDTDGHPCTAIPEAFRVDMFTAPVRVQAEGLGLLDRPYLLLVSARDVERGLALYKANPTRFYTPEFRAVCTRNRRALRFASIEGAIAWADKHGLLEGLK